MVFPDVDEDLADARRLFVIVTNGERRRCSLDPFTLLALKKLPSCTPRFPEPSLDLRVAQRLLYGCDIALGKRSQRDNLVGQRPIRRRESHWPRKVTGHHNRHSAGAFQREREPREEAEVGVELDAVDAAHANYGSTRSPHRSTS